MLGVLGLMAVLATGLAWPAGSAAQNDLRALYQTRAAQVVSLKSVTFVEGCGYYRLGASRVVWKYLEAREGLYVEERSAEWRRLGAASPEEANWERCMHHTSGRGSLFSAMGDVIVGQVIRWF